MQNSVSEVITTLVPLVIAAWAGWTAWRQKERNDKFKQDLQLREVIQTEKRAEWEEADRQHKRRMEELTAVSVRQGNLAIRTAKEAAQAAAASKDEIIASRDQRIQQFDELKEVNIQARDVANGHNGKIAQLTEELRIQREEILRLQKPQQPTQNPEAPNEQ